jgi:hypothetical protein
MEFSMEKEVESKFITLDGQVRGLAQLISNMMKTVSKVEDTAGTAKRAGQDNESALNVIAKRLITLEKSVEALEKAAAKRK